MLVLSVVIIAFTVALLAALVRFTYLHMATGQPVTRLGQAYRAGMQQTSRRQRVAASGDVDGAAGAEPFAEDDRRTAA